MNRETDRQIALQPAPKKCMGGEEPVTRVKEDPGEADHQVAFGADPCKGFRRLH